MGINYSKMEVYKSNQYYKKIITNILLMYIAAGQ
jgi:hypothetical protein